MLDIKLIRENPEAVKKNIERRRDPEKLKMVDELLKEDKSWRESLQKLEVLRAEKNAATDKIAKMKKEKNDAKKEIEKVKRALSQIAVLEKQVERHAERVNHILMRLPNLLHESVAAGKDDGDNKEVRKWGKIEKKDFTPKSHVDLLASLDLADLERAGKVAGARFYYLKNELAILDLALQKFALDFLLEKGFIPLQPPFMMRRKPYEGVTDLQDFEDMLYKIEGDDLYPVATSEHPMAAMFMGEVMPEACLPAKYAGVSPCFRKEAGAHGKDTKGIFRVHQFNKVEQFVFSRPEDSWKIFEELIKNSEEIFQKLELPYRVVSVCTGDIGTVAAKKYDLEVWMPAQQQYREAVSCSNCTDYQARRLNIRYGKEGEKPAGFVHTLNSTAIATTRTMVAILENFQDKQGNVHIPRALWDYTGFRKIEKTE